jgi:hypothetical protein
MFRLTKFVEKSEGRGGGLLDAHELRSGFHHTNSAWVLGRERRYRDEKHNVFADE